MTVKSLRAKAQKYLYIANHGFKAVVIIPI